MSKSNYFNDWKTAFRFELLWWVPPPKVLQLSEAWLPEQQHFYCVSVDRTTAFADSSQDSYVQPELARPRVVAEQHHHRITELNHFVLTRSPFYRSKWLCSASSVKNALRNCPWGNSHYEMRLKPLCSEPLCLEESIFYYWSYYRDIFSSSKNIVIIFYIQLTMVFSELSDCNGKCSCLKNSQCDLHFDMTSCGLLNEKA